MTPCALMIVYEPLTNCGINCGSLTCILLSSLCLRSTCQHTEMNFSSQNMISNALSRKEGRRCSDNKTGDNAELFSIYMHSKWTLLPQNSSKGSILISEGE